MSLERIRNFSIIAHIDHGKSTLADRFLELTNALSQREMAEQVLDAMDLERERGITIKAHAVTLNYEARDGELYTLNLIDTPGHVDFSYEVSRSMAACEGALLVVDASQGVEAQTLANAYLAAEADLTIIPVVNKVDLPAAQPEAAIEQIESIVGIAAHDALRVSAKLGLGVSEVLEALVERVPPPGGNPEGPLRALIFDSWFDSYRGVMMLVRVMDGTLRTGLPIRLLKTGAEAEVDRLGLFTPKPVPVETLGTGEVGFVAASIKDIHLARVGDTLTEASRPASVALPGFKELRPMVYSGLYPAEGTGYESLRRAVEKLSLNDGSFTFSPENSVALGFGFRAGYLGTLHMEIVQERLEREFGLALINTAPGVGYRVLTKKGEILELSNPSKLPEVQEIDVVEEPVIEAVILTRDEYLGAIFKLCEERRGRQKSLEYLAPGRVLLTYRLPLAEVVMDFFDRLKSLSRGYASLDYHFVGYDAADLVRLDIQVNGEPVDALCSIVHRDKAYARGRTLSAKMRELIPRQLFEVVIQASIGSRVIARESVRAMRKNVVAKCYGGDVTRKRKLIEKQREGKRRMKRVGKVDVPQEAFLAVLKGE